MWYVPLERLSKSDLESLAENGFCKYPKTRLLNDKEPEFLVPSKHYFLGENGMDSFPYFCFDLSGCVGGAGAKNEKELYQKLPDNLPDIMVKDYTMDGQIIPARAYFNQHTA
ncbi:MAG: hypothetical protein PHE67_00595 [Campylobacterales bacterium]|nr:hypothetical protein [Campylobacterales bacterium]